MEVQSPSIPDCELMAATHEVTRASPVPSPAGIRGEEGNGLRLRIPQHTLEIRNS